jgi:hypothetical protein
MNTYFEKKFPHQSSKIKGKKIKLEEGEKTHQVQREERKAPKKN